VLRQTASTHVFRIPRSAGAFLVCVDGNKTRSSWVSNEERQGKHAQYGYARLDQRAVLHAEKPIPEQVTFGLSAATTATKERGHRRITNNRRHGKTHTWSPRRLSLSSSPSCTSTSPARTTCLPSRCPARPSCAMRASCLPRRSLAACSRPASVLSAALRRTLTESTDVCSRFRKLRSKRARF